MTREIPLTRGKVALVDDEDYEELSRHKWYAGMDGWNWYPTRGIMVSKGKQTHLSMHRAIMNPPQGYEVDHINGDGLDNRRSNLRVVTHAQNLSNRKRQKTNNLSGFKGVSPHHRRYIARIGVRGQQFCLGNFATAEEAARAYDDAARRYFGEFARTNFPDGEE